MTQIAVQPDSVTQPDPSQLAAATATAGEARRADRPVPIAPTIALSSRSTATAIPTDRRASRTGAGLRSPIDPEQRIFAVLFDLDGTLYDQKRMRTLMAFELATLFITRPLTAPRTVRVLSVFRAAQESLRGVTGGQAAGVQQLETAARRLGMSRDSVERIVDEWMIERPLKHMSRCRAAELFALLAYLGDRGVERGILSDYPAERKLKALGLAGHFSIVVSASDAEVGVFKPHPRGFLAACARWQLAPSQVLYVGDRADADAAGAAAAGMPCVIVGSRAANRGAGTYRLVPSLEGLHRILDAGNVTDRKNSGF